tara:strand:+ start:1902 stop:2675 length:774 start_codon:yes stop_codon:yes gene_type:complete
MTAEPDDFPPASLTRDGLLDGRVVLHQPREGYRAAIDPVLLAAAVPATAGARVLELGIGAGAAALCLARRVPDCRITGIERDRAMVRLAGRNIIENGFQSRIEAVIGDVGGPPAPRLTPGGYDHVMANPPYLPPDRADPSPVPGRRAAGVESDGGLAAWVRYALQMVRTKGTVTFIQRADRLDALLALLMERAGDTIVFPLWPHAGKAAKRVIVQARKGIAGPLTLSPGLVLHGEGQSYTAAADAVLRDGQALGLRS